MKVLITGATGLIGRRLCSYLLSKKCRVSRLLRKTKEPIAGIEDYLWDPATGMLPLRAIEGQGAVIHLAGAAIAGARLSSTRKQLLWNSRILSTSLLVQKIQEVDANKRPQVLICASATSYYAYGEEPIGEEEPPGTGFFSDLCKAWEAEAATATTQGLRVVQLRIGLVLSTEGGALRTLVRIQRLGLGAVLGTGKQHISWIHIQDLMRMIHHALENDKWTGPYNATSPHPVTHSTFVRAIASAHGRRLWLPPIPAILLRLLLGSASDLLLKGQQVLPIRSQSQGFKHIFSDLGHALDKLVHE